MLDADNSKLAIIAGKPEFKDAITLLNDFGKEYVDSVFRVTNKGDRGHNIIKTVIIAIIYKQNEKKDVVNFLQMAEKEEGEYIFINIVIPKMQYIDFNTVENVLSVNENRNGFAHEIYNMLTGDAQIIPLQM